MLQGYVGVLLETALILVLVQENLKSLQVLLLHVYTYILFSVARGR